MKRVILLGCCLLLTWPALAGTSPACELGPAGSSDPFLEILLVQVGQDGTPGDRQLTVRYEIDGAPFFKEVLHYRTISVDDPQAVELLAWFPSKRRELIARPADSVSIVLEPESGPGRLLTLADARSETSDLTRARVELLATRSEAAPTGTETVDFLFEAATDSCVDDCYWYYDRCESSCGTPPAEDCLQRCDSDLQQCLSNCDTCPSERLWTETVLVTSYITGIECLPSYPGGSQLEEYYREYRQYKKTTYRETTACDGTVTTEVVGFTYVPGECWKPRYWLCYVQEGPMPNCLFY